MKRPMLFLEFVTITIALTFFWEESGRVAYGRYLKTVAPPI